MNCPKRAARLHQTDTAARRRRRPGHTNGAPTMQRPPAHHPITPAAEAFDPLLEGMVPRRAVVPAERTGRELRCASSGYLSHGCRCQITIPEHVVAAAWERERLFGNSDDRFFRVVWRDEAW